MDAFGDDKNLFDGFPGAVNDLGRACTQGSMVVNAGESQVFVWQISKVLKGLLNWGLAPTDLIQQ